MSQKNNESADKMDFLKKHADTITIIAAVIASMLWMNGKFNELEKEVAIVKTVLIMKNIMPEVLVKEVADTELKIKEK